MENKTKKLIGCIDKLSHSTIRTRFFYLNPETNEVQDVTLELCSAIDAFNERAKAIRKTGEYSMIIPYQYKYGLAEYSFGCGLSHYLQENTFEKIEEASFSAGNMLSFPLVDCRISMYTPDAIKHILNCKNVFDTHITEALINRYGLEQIA